MIRDDEILNVRKVAKSFTLHQQGGAVIRVLDQVSMSLKPGDAVALAGPSGIGKSTLMRMVYGNYHCQTGRIDVLHKGERVDIASASERQIIEIRRHTIGYISQFLRVIPRVPTIEIVAEPLKLRGVEHGDAIERAGALLARLNIPEKLWPLSPVTFSGGEQQRVNIARGFAVPYPLLLLDEPTASLDAENRAIVIDLISETRNRGSAILGIFHDEATRNTVCCGVYEMRQTETQH